MVEQGDAFVSSDPSSVLPAILGSCVSACLYDAGARVGGMNHFLLAKPGSSEIDANRLRCYGVYAMESLIEAMLAQGAQRHCLRARLYGGATMRSGFGDIGGNNGRFAKQFLRNERILLVAEDIGGTAARRVEFRAGLGLARCRIVTDNVVPAPRVVRAALLPTGFRELGLLKIDDADAVAEGDVNRPCGTPKHAA